MFCVYPIALSILHMHVLYSVYVLCSNAYKAVFNVISAVQGEERVKRAVAILANVSGLYLKSESNNHTVT
jgi:hypothetical protein